MTSDGISSEDWERVQMAAIDVVGETAEDDSADLARQTLLRILDELESKYGRRPSILATRADYCENVEERVALLLEANQYAQQINDHVNQFEVADSMAATMIRVTGDVAAARDWLRAVEAVLLAHHNEEWLQRYAERSEELRVLESEHGHRNG